MKGPSADAVRNQLSLVSEKGWRNDSQPHPGLRMLLLTYQWLAPLATSCRRIRGCASRESTVRHHRQMLGVSKSRDI